MAGQDLNLYQCPLDAPPEARLLYPFELPANPVF